MDARSHCEIKKITPCEIRVEFFYSAMQSALPKAPLMPVRAKVTLVDGVGLTLLAPVSSAPVWTQPDWRTQKKSRCLRSENPARFS